MFDFAFSRAHSRCYFENLLVSKMYSKISLEIVIYVKKTIARMTWIRHLFQIFTYVGRVPFNHSILYSINSFKSHKID